MDDVIREDQPVQLKDERNTYFLKVRRNATFTTHKGTIKHDDLIGKPYGESVSTHLGHEYIVLKPTLYEIIMFCIKRKTQIVYPKDSAYICLKLGITNRMRVLEVGLGSGAMTVVLANAVGENGRVIVYERDERFIDNALENISLTGLQNRVEVVKKDITEGADHEDFDAAFVDMREPWLCLKEISKALRKTSPVGFILPTTNQVSQLLMSLKESGFLCPEVEEIILRPYKTVPERLRPVDVMPAHTGYIVFARTPG